MRHIREQLSRQIRIVVVAGVVQEGDVIESDMLQKDLVGMGGEVSLVALRVSDNKYAGKGTTDTGRRLFKSHHLDCAACGWRIGRCLE